MYLQHRMYHLADVANWPSIQRHGLLSAQALLELAGIEKVEQLHITQQQRQAQLVLPNGATIRDQKPMPPTALERCLLAATPAQWYTLLNSKVFFWFDIERLNRMRKVYSLLPQVVLVVDTERLLARHAARVTLSPINTGNARRHPALRSPHTFVPYATWLKTAWASETNSLGTRPRPKNHHPVELTVTNSVPDIMDFVIDMHYLAPTELFKIPSIYA
ncbi:MAG: hypothetical protein PVS3B1_26920 [Ktedonobacteraceae bacterium]